MPNYVIGIDFGTYQTKASINHLDKRPQKHEFFEFNYNNSFSFFLPSKVFFLKNELVAYGNQELNDVLYEFNYFKIASAEDDEFRILSEIDKPIYTYTDSYHGYSPEFLSVIYLSFVLLLIKQNYNKRLESNSTGRTDGLFSKLKIRVSETNNFRIRLGIPTEYSKEANIRRRRKFEIILLISELIQKELNYSLIDFLKIKVTDLIDLVKKYNAQIPKNEQDLDKVLNDNQLSVFPESAAGLLYFVKTGKLKRRSLYAALDIGGGTSDMSFFNVLPDGKINYLSSESYLIACNNIYLKCNEENTCLEDLTVIENTIQKSIIDDTWEINEKYVKAVKEVKSKIGVNLKKIILEAFKTSLVEFEPSKILRTLKNQPILIYGGGLSHPEIKSWDKILIFDNGGIWNEEYLYYMDIQDINLYKPDKSLILNNNWEKDFPFLIVAFGLSYLYHSNESYWDDSEYKSISLRTIINEVPHPTNEGMYVYKIIERKWE